MGKMFLHNEKTDFSFFFYGQVSNSQEEKIAISTGHITGFNKYLWHQTE